MGNNSSSRAWTTPTVPDITTLSEAILCFLSCHKLSIHSVIMETERERERESERLYVGVLFIIETGVGRTIYLN